LKRKLKEFEEAGFVVRDGEKSIHDPESIRFMREVIKAGKWQMNVLQKWAKPGLEGNTSQVRGG
jgi:hypothetical protein